MKTAGMIRDVIKSLFSKKAVDDSLKSFIDQYNFEIKIQNKLAIIKYHNDTIQKPFIFLDADAFLIQKIDELLNESFDIGVTLIPEKSRCLEHNRCRLLNVGFIVFSGEYHKNKILIDTWYQKARETKELCSEQTSLARVLLAYRPDIYDNFNTIKTISIDNTEVKINILPTSIYNFSSIEKYLNTPDDRIKVLHFKNSRFKTPMFAEIAKQLDMK